MDASRNFSSPTVDFVLGNGASIPTPTLGDLLEILHAAGRQLRKDGLLEHVIGNRNVFGTSSEVWDLKEGITKAYHNGRNNAPEAYSERLRARKIYASGSHTHHSVLNYHPYLEEAIFLGYDRGDFMWLWLVKHCSHSDSNGPAYCYDLTSPGGRMAFEESDMPRGTQFGMSVLLSLDKILKDEVKERRERLTRLEAGSITISNMIDRFGSTLTKPRISGDGIEG